ncbi:hypothetical protein [Methylogaea oryzae]|nr:hypothetical protein [Methylogaea oryzae]
MHSGIVTLLVSVLLAGCVSYSPYAAYPYGNRPYRSYGYGYYPNYGASAYYTYPRYNYAPQHHHHRHHHRDRDHDGD